MTDQRGMAALIELRTTAGTSSPAGAYGRWLVAGVKRKAKCPALAVQGSMYCRSHRDESFRRVAARARA